MRTNAEIKKKIMPVSLFPRFCPGGNLLQYVKVFKYLGLMIANALSDDNVRFVMLI